MSAGNVIADPNISSGVYRVLTTTLGDWVLVDERNAIGEQTVARRKSKDAIVACMLRLVGEGSPRLAAAPDVDTATSSPRTSSTATSSRGTSRKDDQRRFALSGALPVGAARSRVAHPKRKRAS